MINKNQVESLSSVFNASEIKEFIEEFIYAYLIYFEKEKNPKNKIIFSSSPYSSLTLFRGHDLL